MEIHSQRHGSDSYGTSQEVLKRDWLLAGLAPRLRSPVSGRAKSDFIDHATESFSLNWWSFSDACEDVNRIVSPWSFSS